MKGLRLIAQTAWAVALVNLAAVLAGSPAAGESSEALKRKLAEFPGAERGQVIDIVDDAVARSFPGFRFSVLRFRQYPVALVPPAPLHANNLFAVAPDGAVARIAGAGDLETFFRDALAPVTSEAQAGVVVTAWLRLAQEFLQDGFLHFSIPNGSLTVVRTAVGGFEATGQAIVNARSGDAGEIVGTLAFDDAGKLMKAVETADIRKGIRPICQASKLLDPDLVVRGMAEQALLVMGRGAGEYLAEQRRKASPELRQAIDRIWQRILLEDR